MEEVWYTLDDVEPSENSGVLYCISVDSPDKQFLAGRIGVPTHNSEEGKAEDESKGEASMIIGSIARLGRAAGVHLIIATQRPDATILPGETKANMGVRINCGRTDANASSMILGTSDGARVKANPRGRLYLRIYGAGDHGQGFFASPTWIDEYLESQGLNQDGTPITGRKSKLANVADMSQFEGADLDAREGVDNSAIIEKMRADEENENFDEDEDYSDLESMLGDYSDEDSNDTGDDGDFGFSDEDDEPEQPQTKEEELVRPTLNGSSNDSRKWHRPEDDWDDELEELINENSS